MLLASVVPGSAFGAVMMSLAYVDPLSGSVILQVLAAGILGGAFAVKRFWRQIGVSLRLLRDRIRSK